MFFWEFFKWKICFKTLIYNYIDVYTLKMINFNRISRLRYMDNFKITGDYSILYTYIRQQNRNVLWEHARFSVKLSIKKIWF